MLVMANLMAKNNKINANTLKTTGTNLVFDKNNLNLEKIKVKPTVATSHPSSKTIKNKKCPPATCSLSKNACGIQIVIQKIQNGPLNIVRKNIFLKSKTCPSPPSSLIFHTCTASQIKTPAPIKEIM